MKIKNILSLASLFLLSAASFGQGEGISPKDLLKPLAKSWPTYNGDYTGKRYSALTMVNRETVKNLGLAWSIKLTPGSESTYDGSDKAKGNSNNDVSGNRVPTNFTVGGEGPGNINIRSGSIKGSVLAVDGTLYVTMPDNAWALDARDGHQLWHYFWKTRGGTHIGNRGFGMWNGYLYMETPDDYLVSLDSKTGKERWHRQIADMNEGYFATPAPIVVGNHVLVGVGNDIDSPGFLQSYDADTGKLQWKFYTVPMKKGDPGADTWASLDAARHGGAQTWITGAYDPDTNLYIFGTANPTRLTRPVHAVRRKTCLPVHLLHWTSIPARWPGTFRPHRMTCTITIRRRRRFSSTVSSTARCASSSRPQLAMVISSLWIASLGSIWSPVSTF